MQSDVISRGMYSFLCDPYLCFPGTSLEKKNHFDIANNVCVLNRNHLSFPISIYDYQRGIVTKPFCSIKKSKDVFTCINGDQKYWCSFMTKDYVPTLKLFIVIRCCGLQGWKGIETWKKRGNLVKFWNCILNKRKTFIIILFNLPDKIDVISSPSNKIFIIQHVLFPNHDLFVHACSWGLRRVQISMNTWTRFTVYLYNCTLLSGAKW